MTARKARLAAALVAAALAGAGSARQAAGEGDCERILPLEEAQRLSGVKPLRLVRRGESARAVGTCNYASAGGQLVLLVTVERTPVPGRRERFERDAKAPGVTVVPRVGDAAFAKDGAIFFRKGTALASVGSFVDPKAGRLLVDEERTELVARAVAKRLR